MISSDLRRVAAFSVFLLFPVPGGATQPVDSSPDVAVATTPQAKGELLPELEGLKHHVAFWRKVFAVWSQGQVALHDSTYPRLVYEVLDLPGEVTNHYSSEQRAFVRSRREALERRLDALERKVAARETLAPREQALLDHITLLAGRSALRGAHERVRSQRGVRERFRRGLEISGRYDALFRQIFRQAGVPEDLAYLPHVESSFQASARSSAGAVGIWQFTRAAGQRFMTVNSAVDERLDPVAAARGCARYLKYAHRLLGDWPMAITSYNHGIGGMLKAKARYGTDFERIVRDYDGRLFGFASRNFYAEFLAARDIAQNPREYFPEGLSPEPPLALDHLLIKHPVPAHHIARHYGVPLHRLTALNGAWSDRAEQGRVPLPAGTDVWLPRGTLQRVSAPLPATTQVASAKREASAPRKAVRSGRGHVSRYVVRANDTLSEVAARHKMSVAALRRLNNMSPKDERIVVGQTLRVSAVSTVERVAQAGAQVYVVHKGDSPARIAQANRVSLRALLTVNQLAKGDVIYPGQKLRIPTGSQVVHIVRAGDNASTIAATHNVSLSDLLAHNDLGEHDVIRPGERVVIPVSQ